MPREGGLKIDAESRLVLLGTGTPNAEPTRSGPSVAVVVGDRAYLVDFGPGVVRQAAAARASGIETLDPVRLSCAFATHLHSDHTSGLPDLILTPWTLGREEPLRLYGPPGIRSMVDGVLNAYAEDVRERLEGLEPANQTGCHVEVTEIEPGLVLADEQVRVEAFAVRHGGWPAFGYRIITSDRVYAISGDTAPFPSWEEAYAGCDVLVHEVQSAVGLASRTPAWRAYHEAMHTTGPALAEVASVVRPSLLVLYHSLPHGVSEAELMAEVRHRYDGEVVLGNDLDSF